MQIWMHGYGTGFYIVAIATVFKYMAVVKMLYLQWFESLRIQTSQNRWEHSKKREESIVGAETPDSYWIFGTSVPRIDC